LNPSPIRPALNNAKLVGSGTSMDIMKISSLGDGEPEVLSLVIPPIIPVPAKFVAEVHQPLVGTPMASRGGG
jgi:hypothetical protein